MLHSEAPTAGCGLASAVAEAFVHGVTCESTLIERPCVSRSENFNRDKNVANSSCDRYMLWIDGVGAWQLCVGSQFVIGGPTLEGTSPDVCLMANLSRRHATLQRNGEDWFIHPYHSTVVSGRSVTGPTLLRTGDAICLAERVRLGFRIPSILSGSAMIDFESHHRPNHSVNGIILMTDSVLLGPRKDHHVCCSDWPDLVVIYRQEGQLRCRSKAAMSVNGDRVRDSAVLHDGAIVSGDDFRFRIENKG
jgi:pSer/pThr/pTyr-binding forkhead associated (FHA) protein